MKTVVWATRVKCYNLGNDPFTISGMNSSEKEKEDQVVTAVVRYTGLNSDIEIYLTLEYLLQKKCFLPKPSIGYCET